MYPPIIASAMPAFIGGSGKEVRIYFALSQFNRQDGINSVQVSVRYQSDNTNALNTNLYPNKIKSTPWSKLEIGENDQSLTDARYYITLKSQDIIGGVFDTDALYKLQIRFSPLGVQNTGISVTDLAQGASEWSTVCILKPIDKPILNFEDFDTSEDEESGESVKTFSSLDPIFTATYKATSSRTGAETLKTWRMDLYDAESDILITTTDDQMINVYESNGLSVAVKGQLLYTMQHNHEYKIVFSIESKNGYKDAIEEVFTANALAAQALNGKIELNIDEDDGYAKVIVDASATSKGTSLTLRRTSSLSNFRIWEDIANYTTSDAMIHWQFDDFTIESGTFYQYGVQIRDKRGRRGALLKTSQEMGQFDDAFLVEKSGDKSTAIQLKLRFDTSISNANINIGESKTDTIGSKYPYVRRVGNMYYREFPISSLITAYMDNNHIFVAENSFKDSTTDGWTGQDTLEDNHYLATDKSLYHGQKDLYDIAYGSNVLGVISGKYDYTYEREFRQKVQKFLTDNKPKLFRSLTQGNILVKLINVSFTPVQDLGRLVYSFDATAVEIDDVTIKNLDAYGIQRVGTYTSSILWSDAVLGQLNRYSLDTHGNIQEEAYPAGFDLMGAAAGAKNIPTIRSKYYYGKPNNGQVVTTFDITYLKITIESDPYLIQPEGNTLRPLRDDESPNEKTLLGTLIQLNDTVIMIEPPNNIYEIKGDNVHISPTWSIIPLKETKMILDYNILLSKEQDTTHIATSIMFSSKLGQLCDLFDPYTSLWILIYQKYYEEWYDNANFTKHSAGKKPYYKHVTNIPYVDIEALPGTILYIKLTTQNQFVRVIIDDSFQLKLEPGSEYGSIRDAYFYGINVQARRINKLDAAPVTPHELDLYKNKIFYKNHWRNAVYNAATQSYDIECPVDAIVNYQVALEKGIY